MKKKYSQELLNNQKKKIKANYNSFLKYSNLSMQMGIIVLAGAFGGVKIDKWIGNKIPVFTLLLSLIAVCLAIYIAVKDFLKKN